MHVLITAGPTREYLDDVRFLSNPSTGSMGFACAEAAARAGHRVTLVTGPSALPDLPGVKTVRVTSALEMRAAAMRAYRSAGAVIATAAVSDYRPARRLDGKMKKGPARVSLALVRTPDILGEMGRRKGRRLLIGFALETRDEVANALAKLAAKRLDHVVLDSPAAFGAHRMDATVIHADGSRESFRRISKSVLARLLVDLLK
ncbi:MAG TPA: phosphopantothenoylcysteine decarboxylase [Planctomycetota bacterium]|nr:phosphopantothenoylcysteine decarboxylase [Planctomycetota bacterium]